MDGGVVSAAFSEDHVERLTHLSKARLRYWARTGFFAPTFSAGESPADRVYSFRDIVALRTLGMLRVQNNVPLQHLRRVAERLAHLQDDLWTGTTLWALNRRVVFQEPGSERPREVLSGQYVMGIRLGEVMTDTTRDVAALFRRSEAEVGRIAQRRGPGRHDRVIAGTRIHVASIRRLHEDGYTTEQILSEYPDLTEADVSAALAAAA